MMISVYFILIFLLSLVRLIFMNPSPFQLTFDYHSKQILNQNFTITTKLQSDLPFPIDCKNHHRENLCLVGLILQIKSNSMSLDVWCQAPAFAYGNIHRIQSVYTCLLPAVNSNEQPSITIMINAHDTGQISPIVTANFTYLVQYSIQKQGEIPIDIVV